MKKTPFLALFLSACFSSEAGVPDASPPDAAPDAAWPQFSACTEDGCEGPDSVCQKATGPRWRTGEIQEGWERVYPGGMCTYECEHRDDCPGEKGFAICVRWWDDVLCHKRCDSNKDCPEPYYCSQLFPIRPENRACMPECTDPNCTDNPRPFEVPDDDA
jgi:hypothetical protein